jgi:uncharacterized protein YukE
MTEYAGLGFDPAPGSPDAVAAASARFRDIAERAGTAETDLRQVPAIPADWAGDAAEGFTERLTCVPDSLATLRGEMSAAARVLDDWLEKLAARQRTAENLDRQALVLRGRIGEARDAVERHSTEVQFLTGSARRTAEEELESTRRRLGAATEELERLVESARQLLHDHLADAGRVAGLLRAIPGGAAPEITGPAGTRFRAVRGGLADYSTLGHRLASVLSPLTPAPGTAAVPPPGAAGAFAAAAASGGRWAPGR